MKPWVLFDINTRAAMVVMGGPESEVRKTARTFAEHMAGRRIGYVDAPVPGDAALQNSLGRPYLIYAKPCDIFCS